MVNMLEMVELESGSVTHVVGQPHWSRWLSVSRLYMIMGKG